MRILVVNWQDRENPQAGGAELHIHEAFSRLVNEGHEVDLLVSGFDGGDRETVLDGMKVLRVGTRMTFPLKAKDGWNELRKRNYDVIVEALNKIPVVTPGWTKDVPVVGLVHHLFGTTAFQEANMVMATAVWIAERIIPLAYKDVPFQVISQSTGDDLEKRGIDKDHITVVYPGSDTTTLFPREPKTASPSFVYLGRIKRYKRVDLIIRAFAMALKRGMDTNSTLVIGGGGDDRGRLELLAKSQKVEGNITFAGFVPEEEKAGLLSRSWASLMASPKEGWGIANMEAAACGTPVIAVNAPGVRESVVDKKSGFLTGESVDEISIAMMTLAADQILVERMGLEGRRHAEQFTWDRTAKETAEHLEAVVRKHLGGR